MREVLDLWNIVSLSIFDTLLGWSLHLPSTLTLIILALVTSGLMVLIRPWTTNQDLLARVDRDNRRLKELKREAKQRRDREALLRYQATSKTLSMRKLAAEGKPLALAIVPLALLATWAMQRLEFHPPAENEVVEVAAYLSSVGEIMHIVPQQDLESTNGWVQRVEAEPTEPSGWDKLLVRLHLAEAHTPEPDAVARWKLKGKARTEPYKLLFRFRDVTIGRELLIGQTTYAPFVEVDDDRDPVIMTRVILRPVEFFGIPGLGEWCPGWLVGYLIIVVPLVFLLKWALKIY